VSEVPVARRRRVRLAFAFLALAVPALVAGGLVLHDAWRWRRPLVLGKWDAIHGVSVLPDGRRTVVLDDKLGLSLVGPSFPGLGSFVGLARTTVVRTPAPNPTGGVGYFPAIAASHDGRLAFMVDVASGVGHLVSIAAGSPPAMIDTYAQVAAFSRDDHLLATGGVREPAAVVWEVASGEPLHVVEVRPNPSALAFSADGRSLLSVDVDGVAMTPIEAGRARTWHRFLVGAKVLLAAWFLPGDTRIALVDDEAVRVLDAATFEKLGETSASPGTFDAAGCTSDGRLAALAKGAAEHTAGSAPWIAFYDTATWTRVADAGLVTMFPEIALDDRVAHVALSPEGDVCVVAMRSGLVVRFPVPRGERR
jgi:hypothetical protein